MAVVVTDIVKLIQIRNVKSVTASQASQDAYGTDYTSGSTEAMIKFELWLDAEGIDTLDANAIAIESFSVDIDWSATQLKAVDSTLPGPDGGMIFSDPNDNITLDEVTGQITLAPSSAIVDIDTTNDDSVGIPIEKHVAKIGRASCRERE